LVDVSLTLSAIRDVESHCIGVSSIARDITQRKRAEQELKLSRERLALALQAAASGTFEWEFATNNVSWSREIEAIYGVPAGGFGGTYGAWESLVFAEDLPRARAAIDDAMSTGQFVSEWRIRRRVDGAVRWIGAQAKVLFDPTQRPTRMIGINLDITERKAAEDALRRYAAELERSNAELQEFAFVASHDLQEPLRKITAFSERLRDRAAGQLDDVSLDYMNRMHNAAERMAALINSLLEYSRVTTRALPFEQVDLAEMMLGILADLEQRRHESKATVMVQALPKVHGDATQLRQLFQNLLANALKFHVRGVPPVIRISAQRDGPRWRIAIADNGIGFDPVYTEKIFKPFQRLHARTEYEGSGMGLAICRKIAQRHGACIDVASAPDRGATFTVSLPAVPSGPDLAPDGLLNAMEERNEPCGNLQYASSLPKMMTTITC
jgi:PAS domain S-box-containing protein